MIWPGLDKDRLRNIWRWLAIALLLALCLVALYTLIFFVSRYKGLPSPGELYQAESIIKPKAEPGDRLAANPRWAYPYLLSGVRHDKGGRFTWIDGVEDANWDCEAQTDLTRIWVVSLFHEGAPKDLEKQGFAPFFEQNLPKTEIFGYRRTVPLKVLSFISEMPRLRIWSEDAKGGMRPAVFDGGQHRFEGDAAWASVRTSLENIGGQVHRCIWTHPQKDRVVKIQMKTPPWAKRLHLDGGLTMSAMWRKEAGLLTLGAENGEEPIASMGFQHLSRWEHTIVDIPDPSAPLTVTIRATDVGGRHFCWRAFVLGDE